jgi:hypothetical protein
MQPLPWGLTIDQTLLIIGLAIAALVVLAVLRFLFNLGSCLIRAGCIVLVMIAALAFVMAVLNRTSGTIR